MVTLTTRAAVSASSGIQWGDFPTWALAVIALLALIAAVAAYFKQADAARKLAEQVNLQREQLQDQQAANRQQADVLEAELREILLREQLIQRHQAEDVKLRLSSTRAPKDMPLPEGTSLPPEARIYEALVVNESQRPIRDVTCRIEPAPGEARHKPGRTGEVVELRPGMQMLPGPTADPQVRLIRAGVTWAFIFPYDKERYPDATITVRFTDDAGLHWQLDHDDHLEKLGSRDDW